MAIPLRFAGDRLTCLRGQRLVFRDLDFAIESGGALVLTGPNGSGKSSLLRLMAGLLRPWAGSLQWQDLAIADDPDAHRGRIAFVGHQEAIKPVLTVLENLMLWSHLAGAGPSTRALAETALERFGLDRLASLPGRYLSSGQKRRLALTRLLVAGAPLWLLDEPAVGLDRSSVQCLEAELARHRQDGGMVVLSTHSAISVPGATTLAMEAAR